jgi:hypothetical protein
MPETTQQYLTRLGGYVAGKDALKIKQATPRRLARLVARLTPARAARRPARGKWSIREILAHMAEAELAVAWRMRRILEEEGGLIQAYDQDAWAKNGNYQKIPLKESLALFTALRNANLRLLKTVPKTKLQSYGMHQERGRMTLAGMMETLAGHDLNHIMQIEKIVKQN